jgi:tellurite methyltransferase
MCDKTYWYNFYNNNNNLLKEPSSFCLFIMEYFENNTDLNILDMGCGNGRDSLYMSKKYNVTGIDTSLPLELKKSEKCNFINSNFCTYDKTTFNFIYSRFSFHSITNKDHDLLLESVKPNTYLCIETRSDKNESDKKYHGSDHFRNYTNIDYLKSLLDKHNFKIIYIEEKNNFAKYKSENPICIRLISKKN